MALPPVKILPDLIVDGRIVKKDGNDEIVVVSTSSLSSSVPIYAPNLTASLTSSYSYFAETASYAANANIDTGSFVTNTQLTSALSAYPTLNQLSSSFVTPSQVTSSITNFPTRTEVTGVLTSYATLTGVSSSFSTPTQISAALQSYATTGSNVFNGEQTISGNLDVLGTVTVNELHITYITSSVIYTSGSTKFGDTNDDTHQFTGSVYISGNISADSFVGIPTSTEISGVITASLAAYATLSGVSSSFATPSQISGALSDYLLVSTFDIFTGSYNTGSFSGSFYGTASYAISSSFTTTASFATNALTASYAANANIDTGSFATTGSNIFKSSQTVSGSINITDNNVIGDTLYSSVNGNPININYGISKGDIANRFTGIKVYNYDWSGGNLAGQVEIWTDSEAQDFSTKRFVVDGFGNTTVSGSLIVTNGITGRLYDTASYALTAAYAENAVVGNAFPYSGSAVITGSLEIINTNYTTVFSASADTLIFTGSIYSTGTIDLVGTMNVTDGVTARLYGTASFALTASYIDGGFY